MRILHLTDSSGLYGKERVILELIDGLNHSGIRSDVVNLSASPSFAMEAANRAASYINVNVNGILNKYNTWKFLEEVIDIDSTDVVHFHDYKSSILFSNFLHVPKVRTFHGRTATSWKQRTWWYGKLDDFVSVSLNSMDACVGVSKDIREQLGPDIYVIPNGISEKFETNDDLLDKEILDFCDRGPTIGTFARLSDEKNLFSLIEAVSEVRRSSVFPHSLQLLILGDGPLAEKLIRAATERSVPIRIRQVHEAYKYLPHIDVYCQPSYREGLPMSVLEAMRQGTLMILSDVGGMSEVLKLGIGMNAGDPRDPNFASILAFQLSVAVNQSANFKRKQYQETFKQWFTNIRMAEDYKFVYERVTGRMIPAVVPIRKEEVK